MERAEVERAEVERAEVERAEVERAEVERVITPKQSPTPSDNGGSPQTRSSMKWYR